MLARLPEGRLDAFDAYESAVLPLLAEYGGHVERRLRSLDDRVEAHIVDVGSERVPGFLLRGAGVPRRFQLPLTARDVPNYACPHTRPTELLAHSSVDPLAQ
jgi:hypothetical protein